MVVNEENYMLFERGANIHINCDVTLRKHYAA